MTATETRAILTAEEAHAELQRRGSGIGLETFRVMLRQGYDSITRTSYLCGIPIARNRALGEDIPRWDVLMSGIEQYAGLPVEDDHAGRNERPEIVMGF
jgi:hypothetical protein